MNKNEQLNKIHSLELKIAVEIKRICEKHNIKYFLIAGTLLGEIFMSYRDKIQYLEYHYGDYMTPPENERVGHDVKYIDFEAYA